MGRRCVLCWSDWAVRACAPVCQGCSQPTRSRAGVWFGRGTAGFAATSPEGAVKSRGRQDGSAPSSTFPFSLRHAAVPVSSLGNKVLALQSRWCSNFPFSSPSLSLPALHLHSQGASPHPGALPAFPFVEGDLPEGTAVEGGGGSFYLGFHARPPSSRPSCSFGDDSEQWPPFRPHGLPQFSRPGFMVCLSTVIY